MPNQGAVTGANRGESNAANTRLLRRFFPGLSSLNARESLPIHAHWRRIFILPTAAGLFFGFSLMLMLVASLNFNNNMGLMLTFWAMGLAQVLLLATFLNLLNVRLIGLRAEPVHAGDNACVHLKLTAPESRTGIQLGWSPVGKKQKRKKQPKSELLGSHCIEADGTDISLPLPTTRRGWMELPRLKIHTQHPAGLFTAWVYARPNERILVYPRPEARPPAWIVGQDSQGVTWHHTSGDDFDGVRPYQYGDPLRLVAWKRSAQVHDLVSREYHSNSGERITFDWSQVQHLPLETAISRLAAWVMKANDAGLSYRLNLPGFDSGYGQGQGHRHHCLRALATFGLNP